MKIIFWVFIFAIVAQNLNASEYGISNLLNISDLHKFNSEGAVYQMTSSADKDGENCDGYCNSYLYIDENGEKVIFEAITSGVIQRIWLAKYSSNDTLHFYFDGDKTPTYSFSVESIFARSSEYFPKELNLDFERSSGAYICYTPFQFKNSLKITCSKDAYYQFGWYKYTKTDASWDYNNINNQALDVIKNIPNNPINVISSEIENNLSVIKPNEKAELLGINYSGILNGIKVKFDYLTTNKFKNMITDDGREVRGGSEFIIKLPEGTKNLKVIKRYFCGGTIVQQADAYINNVFIYEINKEALDKNYAWINLEMNFDISNFDLSKPIHLEFKHNGSAAAAWNDYKFWFLADNILFDSLDVGNLQDEQRFTYKTTDEFWLGERTLCYYEQSDEEKKLQDIIGNSYLEFYFDDDSEPSISAPIDMFFAFGSYTLSRTQSLMYGMNNEGFLYNYFPIPFYKNCNIYLVNKSQQDIKNFQFSSNYSQNKDKSGRLLKSQYKEFTDFTSNRFMNILDVRDAEGLLVNTVVKAEAFNNECLEGNDLFIIDNELYSCQIGTGTEDFFNSGLYFYTGMVSNPFSGLADSYFFNRMMYRALITDPIYFNKNLRFDFEISQVKPSYQNMKSFCLYYASNNPMLLSDSLKIGDPTSESNHNYKNSDNTIFNYNYKFLGIFYQLQYKSKGKSSYTSTEFDMSISDTANSGVLLYRLFDYAFLNQKAEIYIDDIFAGIWYSPGNNTKFRFKEDFFKINKNLINGKSQINIKIKNISVSPWTESKYSLYILPTDMRISDVSQHKTQPNIIISKMDNTNFKISGEDFNIHQMEIFDLLGNKVPFQTISSSGNNAVFSLVNPNEGVYFITLNSNNKIIRCKFLNN